MSKMKENSTFMDLGILSLNSNLKELKEIPEGVKFLFLNNNQLKKLPKLPKSLQFLDASNNQLSKLPELPNSLEFLYISNNQLKKLPNFPKSLITIDASYNKLEELPNIPKESELSGIFSFNNLKSFPNLENSSEHSLFRFENNPYLNYLYSVKKFEKITKRFLRTNKEYFTLTLKKGTVLFHNMDEIDSIFEMYIGNKKDKIWSVSPDHQTYFFLHPFNNSYGEVTTVNVLTKDVEILYLLEPSKTLKHNDEEIISLNHCKKEKRFICLSNEIKKNNILGWIAHDTSDIGQIWHGETKNFLTYYSYVSYYKNSNDVIDKPEVSLYPFPEPSNDYIYFEDEDVFGIKNNGKTWLENNQHLFNYKTIALVENNSDFIEYKNIIDSLLSQDGLDGYHMKRNHDNGLYYIEEFI